MESPDKSEDSKELHAILKEHDVLLKYIDIFVQNGVNAYCFIRMQEEDLDELCDTLKIPLGHKFLMRKILKDRSMETKPERAQNLDLNQFNDNLRERFPLGYLR